MKLTKILFCAALAGAIAFVSDQAQAVVVGGQLYVPLNLSLTITGIKNGKLATKTGTSKTIFNDLTNENDLVYPKGTILAVGTVTSHIYAINKTNVLDDLTGEGYFSFSQTEDISTTSGTNDVTAYKASRAGTVTLEYADDGILGSANLEDNTGAFSLTGTYTFTESDSAPKDGDVNESVKFSSKNLGGNSYWSGLDADDLLPLSGSASGSGSGKVPVVE